MSAVVLKSLRWLLSTRLLVAFVLAVCGYLAVNLAAETREPTERRSSGDPAAVAPAPVPRPTAQTTRAPQRRAVTPARRPERDGDGDGHESRPFGGDDCDDGDANRYPGNVEVCDLEGHDEDCNPQTFGVRDADTDGFPDARCCNRSPSRQYICGTDCDDGNGAIFPDAQTCSSDGRAALVCRPPAGGLLAARPEPASEAPPWERRSCGSGDARCIPQPNGTGICLP